ncbi:MAG: hypothetical protein WC509_01850 [Candidatus Izemoplasmatales bacterium]
MFASIGFELRVAWRNLTRNLGRSVVILFTMTLISALMIAGFTIDDTFRQIFTMERLEKYHDVDIVMTYDANSTTRIINRRTIAENYADLFVFQASFFNLNAGVEIAGKMSYAQIYSSSIPEMERVIETDLPSIGVGEAIVSRSFAEGEGLTQGSSIDLFVGGTAVPHRVVAVVDDVGILKGDAVFVEKAALLEAIYGIANLGNLGNTMYFALKPGIDADAAIALLAANPEYASFEFTVVMDEADIARGAAFNSSIFIGVGAMALVALALVLRSVFPILFRDFTQQFGVVRILGGSSRFAFRVWIWQFAILLLGACPTGALLAWYAFSIAAPIAGVDGNIALNPGLTAAAIAAIVMFVVIELSIRFVVLRRRSSVSLSHDARAERESAVVIPFVAALTVIVLLHAFGWHQSPWGRLAETACMIGIVFSGSGLLLKVVSAGFRHRPSAFGLFTARHLASDRVAHNSLKVAIMVIMAIAITSMLNLFVMIATDTVGEQIKADYILANVFDYDPSLKEEIVREYQPETISEAVFYSGVVLHTGEGEKRFRYILSMDGAALDDYLDFDIEEAARIRFSDTTRLQVLLPVSLGKVYQLREGDEVTLAISKDLPAATAVVAGFIDTYYDGIAILNIVSVPAYAEVAPINALLLNVEDDDVAAAAMIRTYASRMYFLIDVREVFTETADLFFDVTDYLTLIGWAVVLCFAIVLLNNAILVFDATKADYARLMTLGAGRSILLRLFAGEAAILATIAAIGSWTLAAFFFPIMPELMLLVNNYKVIPFDPTQAAFSIGAGILVFLIGYGTYFVKVRRMRIIDEIKRY